MITPVYMKYTLGNGTESVSQRIPLLVFETIYALEKDKVSV